MLSVAERHKYILDHLNKYGFVRITDVANELGVTKVTIRKDVKILEAKGLLYKVHGSARSANPHVADTDVHVKGNVNREEKERIARKAVELLNDNDSIIMASGSTIYAFAEAIKREFRSHLNVVTTFLKTSVLLNDVEEINVVQLGGCVHKKSLSAIGGYAERFQLLEALLRGRRHRSGTRDHHLDDRGGEAHAGDDALGVEDHHSGRLVEVRAARFRPYLFARRDRRDCDRQPHFGAGGRHGRGGGCRSGDRIGRSRTARRYASG